LTPLTSLPLLPSPPSLSYQSPPPPFAVSLLTPLLFALLCCQQYSQHHLGPLVLMRVAHHR
jgi:hypothetical protein